MSADLTPAAPAVSGGVPKNANRRAGRVERVLRRLGDILRRRRLDVIQHAIRRVTVSADFVPDRTPGDDDVRIAARLLRAYGEASKAASAAAADRADIWSGIGTRQQDYFAMLDHADPSQLAAYLCNMSRHSATHGTVQGAEEHRHLARSASYRRYIGLMAKDKLVSLAEAIGAVPVENPEQGDWGLNLALDADTVIGRIEQRLQMSIRPPDIDGGLFKLNTSRGRFNERDCNAIYTAWFMTHQLGRAAPASICEIGGGVGRVAYWAHCFGVRRYMIVDLPHINVLQGYYLLKALPEANVRLFGEPDNGEDAITIWPGSHAIADKSVTFDVVLNQDSFPEIHADIVRGYLRWIKVIAPRFLSINHESRPSGFGDELQLNVPELVQEIGGFVRTSRTPYWLRRGYVIEDYSVTPAKASD